MQVDDEQPRVLIDDDANQTYDDTEQTDTTPDESPHPYISATEPGSGFEVVVLDAQTVRVNTA